MLFPTGYFRQDRRADSGVHTASPCAIAVRRIACALEAVHWNFSLGTKPIVITHLP